MRATVIAIITALTLITLASVGALGWVLFSNIEIDPTPYRDDAPPYGQTGPYNVGTFAFEMNDDPDRPLRAWVWYPTDTANSGTRYMSGNGLFMVEGRATTDATPNGTDGPYPVYVYSHGSGSAPTMALWQLEHLATHGYVVLGVEHAGNAVWDRLEGEAFGRRTGTFYGIRPVDVARTIDHALDTLNTAGPLAGLLDGERVGVGGHSYGGYTAFAAGGGSPHFDGLRAYCDTEQADVTLGEARPPAARVGDMAESTLGSAVCGLPESEAAIAAAAGFDPAPDGPWPSYGHPRVGAIVAHAPWNAPIFGETLDAVTAPALIIVGSGDDTTEPERDARGFYEGVASEHKGLVQLLNGGHYLFVDVCNPLLLNMGAFYGCSDPVWDLQRAHDLTNHLTLAWLQAHLSNDAEAAAFVAADGVDYFGVTYETTLNAATN